MSFLGLNVLKPKKPPKRGDSYFFPVTTADQVVTDEETDERLDGLIKAGIVKRTDVVDNLESESPDLPLSARMGSELNKNLQWYIDNGYLPDFNSPYKYLYNRGNMCSALTGGWEKGYTCGNGGTLTLNTDHISLATKTGSTGNYITVTTTNMVDLTNIKKLNIKMDLNTPTDTYHSFFYITKTKNGYYDTATKMINPLNGTSFATLETHDIVGNYYVVFMIRGYTTTSNAKVYEIYGE